MSLTNKQRREFVRYMRRTLLALARADARIERTPESKRPSAVTIRTGGIVDVVRPGPQPIMSIPACLLQPDSEAGKRRAAAATMGPAHLDALRGALHQSARTHLGRMFGN